jgi:hypothetical protein
MQEFGDELEEDGEYNYEGSPNGTLIAVSISLIACLDSSPIC